MTNLRSNNDILGDLKGGPESFSTSFLRPPCPAQGHQPRWRGVGDLEMSQSWAVDPGAPPGGVCWDRRPECPFRGRLSGIHAVPGPAGATHCLSHTPIPREGLQALIIPQALHQPPSTHSHHPRLGAAPSCASRNNLTLGCDLYGFKPGSAPY